MQHSINKLQIISSLMWKFMERMGTQGVQLIVQIVLARILMPDDYGIIALITVFISLANPFIQRGFGTALIQKKDADDTDYSSVFYINLFVSALLYGVLFFAAPFIASFYEESHIILILRIMSLILFLGAFNSVQNAVLARNMQFKKQFLSSQGAIFVSAAVGIIMAYMGYRVWALVGQQLTYQLLVTVILWFTLKWRPKLLFSFERARFLFSFGWKITVSSLIQILYLNMYNLIIGKLYNTEMLGFYNRGAQFPSLLVTNIDSSIQSVMFPALSSYQNNIQRMKNMVRRSIMTSSFFLFPIMVGLAVVAKPLVIILLTEKWLMCVPFLQINCIIYALWPIHSANLQAINAMGYSGTFLRLEIIKKIIGVLILGATVFYGVYAIALGSVASGLISTVINSYPNKRLLNYSYKEQWKDIMPSLLLSLVMGAIVYSIQMINLPVWPTLLIQVCIGAVLYVAMASILKLECLTYLLSICKDILKNRKEATE